MSSKQELRAELKARLRQELSSEVYAQRSALIYHQLLEHPLWLESYRVGLYMPLPEEPDLRFLLEDEEHELYLPRVLGQETMEFYPYAGPESLTRSGSFGLWEPKQGYAAVDPQQLDLLVIPALGFDAEGFRLGRGKGYYDRYLSRSSAAALGVCMLRAPLPTLPREAWDLPMDDVLFATEL